MSLVNNMLKDLDQRRKTSDSSGPAADLVPASDTPRSGKSRFLIFFALLLVGVAGGYGYLVYEDIELWDMEVSEALNIIPERTALPAQRSSAETGATVSSASANDAPSSPPNSNPQVSASEPQNTALGSSVPIVVPELPATTLTSNSATPGFSSPASTAGDIGQLTQSPLESIPNGTDELNQAAEPTVPVQGQPIADELADSVAEGAEVATSDTQTDSGQPMSVVDMPPSESVKDYAQMTPEEQDTLAVQYALRLIANNETIAAYTSLEQHIMQNRYAHQSRETYGKLLVNDGEYLAARNVIESGLGLAPNHAGFKKIKARILIANGALSEAVTLLASRAPSINEDLEYHEILATAQLASRDYTGALNSYTQLVRQDRTQGRWWYGFAASQDSLGNRQAARQGYDQALQQSNLSPNLRRRIQERLTVLNE